MAESWQSWLSSMDLGFVGLATRLRCLRCLRGSGLGQRMALCRAAAVVAAAGQPPGARCRELRRGAECSAHGLAPRAVAVAAPGGDGRSASEMVGSGG